MESGLVSVQSWLALTRMRVSADRQLKPHYRSLFVSSFLRRHTWDNFGTLPAFTLIEVLVRYLHRFWCHWTVARRRHSIQIEEFNGIKLRFLGCELKIYLTTKATRVLCRYGMLRRVPCVLEQGARSRCCANAVRNEWRENALDAWTIITTPYRFFKSCRELSTI